MTILLTKAVKGNKSSQIFILFTFLQTEFSFHLHIFEL